MNTPTPASKPWYKNWKILTPIIAVLAIIGLISGMLEDDPENTASDAADETSEVAAVEEVADDAFQSCREVADAGLTNITSEHPRWNPELDRDGDGVSCENEQESSEEETPAEQTEKPANDAPANEGEGPLLPAGLEPHPSCIANETVTQMIPGVLNDETQTVTNGQVIQDGNDTWIGVTVLDADGSMDSRSDVWLLRDGALFSVSGGARNSSWAVAAPGVSMADEYPSGVDSCVQAASLGYYDN